MPARESSSVISFDGLHNAGSSHKRTMMRLLI